MDMRPPSDASIPAMRRMSVVFPDPLAPMSPIFSLSSSTNETWSSNGLTP
jgi:hypothetical protein